MPTSKFACPFAVLGLPPYASEAEVRTKYRKLALHYHPDKNSSSSAVIEMSKINQAKDQIDEHYEGMKRAKTVHRDFNGRNKNPYKTQDAQYWGPYSNYFGQPSKTAPQGYGNDFRTNDSCDDSRRAEQEQERARRAYQLAEELKRLAQETKRLAAELAKKLAARMAENQSRAKMEQRHAERAKRFPEQYAPQAEATEDDEGKSEEELIREHNERLDKIYAANEAKKVAEETKRQSAQWAQQQQFSKLQSELGSRDSDRKKQEVAEQEAHLEAMLAKWSSERKVPKPPASPIINTNASIFQVDEQSTQATVAKEDPAQPILSPKLNSPTATSIAENDVASTTPVFLHKNTIDPPNLSASLPVSTTEDDETTDQVAPSQPSVDHAVSHDPMLATSALQNVQSVVEVSNQQEIYIEGVEISESSVAAPPAEDKLATGSTPPQQKTVGTSKKEKKRTVWVYPPRTVKVSGTVPSSTITTPQDEQTEAISTSQLEKMAEPLIEQRDSTPKIKLSIPIPTSQAMESSAYISRTSLRKQERKLHRDFVASEEVLECNTEKACKVKKPKHKVQALRVMDGVLKDITRRSRRNQNVLNANKNSEADIKLKYSDIRKENIPPLSTIPPPLPRPVIQRQKGEPLPQNRKRAIKDDDETVVDNVSYRKTRKMATPSSKERVIARHKMNCEYESQKALEEALSGPPFPMFPFRQ